MVATAPIFYRIPITQEFILSVVTAQYPGSTGHRCTEIYSTRRQPFGVLARGYGGFEQAFKLSLAIPPHNCQKGYAYCHVSRLSLVISSWKMDI
jgi:hypothetical protein